MSAPLFRKLPDAPRGHDITVMVEDRPVRVKAGESAAAAALLAGMAATRTSPADGSSRAPYCMMGVCFECVATVDGIASVQTCLKQVSDGMRVERQVGKRSLSD